MKCTEILDVGQPAGCSREALPTFKKCQQHVGTRRLVDALETRRTALDDVIELEKELEALKALSTETPETQVGRLLATIKERGIELAEMTRDRNDFQARWQRARAGLHSAAAKIEGLKAVISVTHPGLLVDEVGDSHAEPDHTFDAVMKFNDGFNTDGATIVRDCLGCGALVIRGQHRCRRCVAEGDPRPSRSGAPATGPDYVDRHMSDGGRVRTKWGPPGGAGDDFDESQREIARVLNVNLKSDDDVAP